MQKQEFARPLTFFLALGYHPKLAKWEMRLEKRAFMGAQLLLSSLQKVIKCMLNFLVKLDEAGISNLCFPTLLFTAPWQCLKPVEEREIITVS